MANIIQLSEASTLAIHAMSMIAMSDNHFVSVVEISKHIRVSRNHLSKVMQQLVRAKFVKSSRGPSGGFMLAKESGEITLLDIFEVIEGSIPANPDCYYERTICPFKECYLKKVTKGLTMQLREALQTKTLADFL
jgi:Rrf2 family protein